MNLKTSQEALNEMKMCLLCKAPDEGYSEIDTALHKKFGFHKNGATTYIPSPKSEDGMYHKRISELFNLGS